jgi:hypothetical protein
MEIVLAFPFLSSSRSFILGCFGSDDWSRLVTCAALEKSGKSRGIRFPQGLKPGLDKSLGGTTEVVP